eukprot:m.188717 g.188717  ORF g.188717 m.188717 type:complete len:414 (+) comp32356_c1_seq1:1912-3153(+)
MPIVRPNKAQKIAMESATSVSTSASSVAHRHANPKGPKYRRLTVSKASGDHECDVPPQHSRRWLAFICAAVVGVAWIGYATLTFSSSGAPNDHLDVPEPVPTVSEQHVHTADTQLPITREIIDYDDLVPPPDPRHSAFRTRFENSCGIQYAPNFLSNAEIKHVLSIVHASGGWESSKTGGPKYLVPTGQYTGDFTTAVNADPVVKRIEDRIANATGIPIHSLEDMISLAKIRSRGSSPREGYFVPFGLHHETDTRPNRARTVLIYLVAPKEGGRTLFPLCGPEQTSKASQDVETLQDKFQSALLGQWGERDQDFTRHAAFDPALDHPFNELLSSGCRGESAFAVTPKQGSAILFDSVTQGTTNTPYKHTWHAGCNVIDGEKIILQKFKELPFEHRIPDQAVFNTHHYQKYHPI